MIDSMFGNDHENLNRRRMMPFLGDNFLLKAYNPKWRIYLHLWLRETSWCPSTPIYTVSGFHGGELKL